MDDQKSGFVEKSVGWGEMKINKQKAIAAFLVVILIAFIPLGAAAPIGASESATVKTAKSWIGVEVVHGGNDRSSIDCSHLGMMKL